MTVKLQLRQQEDCSILLFCKWRSFVTDPIIPISSQAGLYYRGCRYNCSVTLPKVTITAFSKPEYTVTKTDSKCYGEKGYSV
jgi:hypothetical protein